MLMLSILLSSVLVAEPEVPTCRGPVATYEVAYEGDREFSVEAKLGAPTEHLDLYFFPSEETPDAQASFIRDLETLDDSKQPLDVSYLGNGTWKVDPDTVSVRYTVSARHDDVSWGPGKDEVATKFDETFFFVGNSILLADYSWPDCSAVIKFDLPKGWQVTSPWQEFHDGYRGDHWKELTFNAFSVGENPNEVFEYGGLEFSWIVARDLTDAEPRIDMLMSKLSSVYTDYFGAAPVENYATFFFTDEMSDGGAFSHSFAMRIATPLTKTEEPIWSHTLGHEMMHTWTGANIVPTTSKEYDEIYWFTEGFTDYLTVKLMKQAGILTRSQYEQRLGLFVSRYRLGQKMSPNTDLKVAGHEKSANWELIYGGGAMVAWLLDSEMSLEDPDGFRKVMRAIFTSEDEIKNVDELMGVMDANSDGRASEAFQWVNEVQTIPTLRQKLAGLGYEVSVFRFDEAYVRELETPSRGEASDLDKVMKH